MITACFTCSTNPIFLGVAVYLIATCWRGGIRVPVQPIELLRWPAAFTLMWALIEKWAYPNWTVPL